MVLTLGYESFLVAVSSNINVAFQGAYGFEPYQIGLCFVSSIVGSVLGIFAGGHLYVTSSATHELLVLDPAQGKPADEPLPVPPNPYAIAADDHWLYVTGVGQHTLTRIAY